MKTDARVRYTKMVVRESLLKLLAQKPIQKVTVKEICELSQINRATFYTHYQDPYDLLEQIENELFNDISSTLMMKLDDMDNLITEVFQVIGKNIDLCRVLFSDNGDKMFLRRILDVSRDLTLSGWRKQYPKASPQQLDYLYAFVIGGSGAVIEQWVRSGMKETPVRLAEAARTVSDAWLAA
jgi:AcrR family transcriptional regulator